MSDRKQERIIALAGVFEAASLVRSLAQTGTCDTASYEALVRTLFIFEPKTTRDVYNNDISCLLEGLTALSRISHNQLDNAATETVRYALSLLALQKQLAKQPDMLEVIRSRLNHIQYNQNHFSDDASQLAGSISGLYQDTLSTLKFRIQVNGNMQHLKQNAVSDKVRTLLLAGIRSAMLWRQLGGNKWQIIFGRSEIEKHSEALLAEIKALRH